MAKYNVYVYAVVSIMYPVEAHSIESAKEQVKQLISMDGIALQRANDADEIQEYNIDILNEQGEVVETVYDV